MADKHCVSVQPLRNYFLNDEKIALFSEFPVYATVRKKMAARPKRTARKQSQDG
jgi:hypothetical protein